MNRGSVIEKLEEIADLVEDLPPGVDVKIVWERAPADLVLLVGLQESATLTTEEHDGAIVERASWNCEGVSIVVRKSADEPLPPPRLRLIRGGKR